MGKRHNKQERRKYAELAASTGNPSAVADSAGVQVGSVLRWLKEFELSLSERCAIIDLDTLAHMDHNDPDNQIAADEELKYLEFAIADLAAHCDGAVTLDYVGFGITTVVPGHHLAAGIGHWDDEDVEAARIVCTIHQDQTFERTGIRIPKPSIRTSTERDDLNGRLRKVSDKPLARVENDYLLITGCTMDKEYFVYDRSLRAWKLSLDNLDNPAVMRSMVLKLAHADHDCLITPNVHSDLASKIVDTREWIQSAEQRKAAKAQIFGDNVAFDDSFPGYTEALAQMHDGAPGAVFYSHVPIEHQEKFNSGYLWWFEKADGVHASQSNDAVIKDVMDNYLHDWVRGGMYVDPAKVYTNQEDNLRAIAFTLQPSKGWRHPDRFAGLTDENEESGAADVAQFMADTTGYRLNSANQKRQSNEGIVDRLHTAHERHQSLREEAQHEETKADKLHREVIKQHWIDADSIDPIPITDFAHVRGSDDFEVTNTHAPYGELILPVAYSTDDGSVAIKKVPVVHTSGIHPRRILGKPSNPDEMPENIQAAPVRQQPQDASTKRAEAARLKREQKEWEQRQSRERRKARNLQVHERWGDQLDGMPIADYVITRDGEWLAEVPSNEKVFVVEKAGGEKLVVTAKSRTFQSKFGRLKGKHVAFVRQADPYRD